jgi:uncharacterized protein
MTFSARELSIQDAAPIEYWVFTVYGVNYRYTTAAENQSLLGADYIAWAGLSHSEIDESGEIPKNNVTFYVPNDFPMMRFYERMPPSDVLVVTIFQIHRGDSDVEPIWTGRVMNGNRATAGAELYAENIFTSLRRNGLRGTYARSCRHDVYSQGHYMCNANPATFAVPALLDSVAGLVLTSGTFVSLMAGDRGRLAGGMLEWEASPGQIEYRTIKAHDGDTIALTHPVDGLVGLDMVTVYPGCSHDRADCNDFFNNIDNYGGFPYTQRLNAMGNSRVF